MTPPPGRAAAGNGSKRRVLIADDHPIVRNGLSALIDAESDLEVCGQAGTGLEALKAARSLRPDIVIVDIALKDESGLSLVRSLRARHSKLALLVLSMFDARLYAERALRAGASGYVMKEEAPEKLLLAIRIVLNGDIYLSEAPQTFADDRRLEKELSDRELEVFRWVGKGFGTTDIAAKLSLSVKTIEAYRGNIKKKLGLRTSTDMLQRALAWSQAEDRS